MALVAVACGSDRPLATVNDHVITFDQVVTVAPAVGGGSSANAEQTREVLAGLVIESAIIQAAEDQYGVVITEEQVQDRIANPPPRYAGVFSDLAAAEASPAQLRSQALRSLVRDAVAPHIIAEESSIDDFIAQNEPFVTRLCAQILVFLDEELAAESAARLQAGEEFTVVAADAGTADPGRVGALDNTGACPAFASVLDDSVIPMALSIPTGEFVGPNQVSSGFAVMKVTDRQQPPADLDVLVDFVDSRRISDFFTPWLNDAVRLAVIDIDPSLGSWSVSGVGIIPPE